MTSLSSSSPTAGAKNGVDFSVKRSIMRNTFPGSSMVERSAVNRNVTGSNPVRGAIFVQDSLEVCSKNASGRWIHIQSGEP